MSSQYRTAITILCAGHPSTDGKASDDNRRNCHSKITIECSSWTVRKQYHEINAKIRPEGWRHLKTAGKRCWRCPACAKFVEKKRKEAKDRGG